MSPPLHSTSRGHPVVADAAGPSHKDTPQSKKALTKGPTRGNLDPCDAIPRDRRKSLDGAIKGISGAGKAYTDSIKKRGDITGSGYKLDGAVRVGVEKLTSDLSPDKAAARASVGQCLADRTGNPDGRIGIQLGLHAQPIMNGLSDKIITSDKIKGTGGTLDTAALTKFIEDEAKKKEVGWWSAINGVIDETVASIKLGDTTKLNLGKGKGDQLIYNQLTIFVTNAANKKYAPALFNTVLFRVASELGLSKEDLRLYLDSRRNDPFITDNQELQNWLNNK